MAKFCSNCGARLTEGKKFCAECGSPLGTEIPAQPAAPEQYAQRQPQPYQQQPQTYQQQQVYTHGGQFPAPKKRKGKKGCLIVVCGFVGFILIAAVAANLILGNTANEDYYSLGNDKIPSVKLVVEKRELSKTETESSGGVTTLTRAYKKVADPESDLYTYLFFLREKEDFAFTKDFFPGAGAGSTQMARESADRGYVVILDVEYYTGGYTLVFTKSEGTFSLNSGSAEPQSNEKNAPLAPEPIASETPVLETAALETPAPLSDEDEYLIELANEALALLKNKDWGAVGHMVHPEQGLTFSPYGYVDTDTAVCLWPGDVISLWTDDTVRTWGKLPSGEPIEYTIDQYYDVFILDRDFTQAKQIAVDTVIRTELESNLYVFGNGCVFVDFYIPGGGSEPDYNWASLRLVFGYYLGDEVQENGLYLVGVVHDQPMVDNLKDKPIDYGGGGTSQQPTMPPNGGVDKGIRGQWTYYSGASRDLFYLHLNEDGKFAYILNTTTEYSYKGSYSVSGGKIFFTNIVFTNNDYVGSQPDSCVSYSLQKNSEGNEGLEILDGDSMMGYGFTWSRIG